MYTDEIYEELAMLKREELDDILSFYPFKYRRKDWKWKQVLDENKKPLNKPKMHHICNMETEQLHSILKDVDYDNDQNYDPVLRTIWEEYHYRKNNHLC